MPPAIADLYQRPNDEVPLSVVREKAGHNGRPMAPATLRKHLGQRKAAQRLYQARLKRSAAAAAKDSSREPS